VEAAGYRVALAGPGQTTTPDIAVDSGTGLPEALSPHTPVVRLRGAHVAAPGEEGSIYRYDREGLIAALRAQQRKG
jgi:two-component system chemotaxis sensor kinase CheA